MDDAAEEPRELAEPEGQPQAKTVSFEKIPVVIQYNKRDLADILAVDALQEALGLSAYPFVEAVASAGRGVTETFKLISKLTFVDLLRRLQGRKAEEEETAAAAAEEARQDDLQTWKDSLLKRDSQANVQAQRPSRPFSLVPRVSDEAPFDTTELGREADAEDEDSPYAVPQPPGLEPGSPMELTPPAATIEIDAIGLDELEHVPEEPDNLSEADEVEDLTPGQELHELEVFESEAPAPAAGKSGGTDPAFLPTGAEARAAGERLALLEERLRESESRAAREREAAERMDQAVSSAHERVAATTEHLSALGARLEALEKGVAVLHEAIGALAQRLVPVETASEGRDRLEVSIQGLESALQAVTERIDSGTARQRKDADDLGMALGTLNEKAIVVDQQMAVLLSQTGTHEDQLSGLRQFAEVIPRLEGQVHGARRARRPVPAARGPAGGAVRPGRPPAPARGPGRGRAAPAPRARVDLRREDPAGPPRSRRHPFADRPVARGARPAARVGVPPLRRNGAAARVAVGVAARPRREAAPVGQKPVEPPA